MDELSRLAQIGFGFGPDLEADRLDPYVTIPPGFSPTALLDCPLGFPNPQEHPGFDGFDRQNQALFGMQIEFSNPVCFPKEDISTYAAELPMEISLNDTPHEAKCASEQRYHPIGDTYEANGVSSQIQQLPVRDQVGRCPRTGTGKPSEDGYNWKKYGQKQVKGSEYPRSYYKCTHPSCLVKKKVERALDGQIREIIYSGSHNHPQPQATHQSAFGSSHAPNDMTRDSAIGTHTDWGADRQEMTSSTSVISDLDHVSTAKRKKPELLTDDTKIDDDENGVTQRSMLHGDDGEFDETESKRRRIEYALIESSSISRAIREPRVIVQTVSEVDILEDGYRWRKYGQKVVKGNPNPRSYYKCTNPGCPVRKHIERAPNDLRSVITTYEGKHNHEVPTCRAVSDIGTSSNSQLHHPKNPPKPEPQRQDFFSCFGSNLEFCGNYLKQSYLGNVAVHSKLVVPSFSDVKLPPLPSFPLHQMIPRQQITQEMSVPFPMGISGPNSALARYELNRGRSSMQELHSLCVQMPNVDHMRILRPPKKEVEYGSPDSPLSYAQQPSPSYSSISADGQL